MAKSRSSRSRKGKMGGSVGTVIHSIKQAELPMSAASYFYDGPVKIPRSVLSEAVYPNMLTFVTNLTSSVTGTYSTVFTNDPTNCGEWSTFAPLYDEYRVLGFDLEFFPNNRYSKVTTVCTPGVGVIDHGSTSVLGSFSAGFDHESCRVLSLEDPWTDRRDFGGNCAPPLRWRMASTDEGVFSPTSVVLSNSAIKLLFVGLTNSTNYGMIVVHFLVQFRGRA